MSVLETKKLCIKRGVKNILKDIDWKIEDKEHTVLFGLNGCGKTTLLAAVSGYMGYTAGEVKLWGSNLCEDNALSLRRQIGFVSNSYFERCYKRENILSIVLSGCYGQLAERYDVTKENVLRAKHLLCSFGLRKKMDYPYDLLSRGQQQRVLIARALMVEPKLLLLDEPCSGLDMMAREFFLNTIEQIGQESRATIVCVTHYEEEILPLFSQVVLLKEGMIHSQGEKKKVLTSENLSDFFGEQTRVYWNEERVQIRMLKTYQADRSIWQ